MTAETAAERERSTPDEPWKDVGKGAVTMLGILPSYAPIAGLIGVTIAGSSAPAAAFAGIPLMFSGFSHLAVVQMVDAGTGVVATVLAALVMNLRLALFSATLAPHWRGTPVRTRLVLAATVIDPTWMLTSRHIAEGAGPRSVRAYYAGVAAVVVPGWTALVVLGAVAGELVPAAAGLSLLAPLCLIAVVAPALRASRAGAVCTVAALVVAVPGSALPAGLGPLLAMAAGVGAAVLVESRERGEAAA